MSTRLGDLLPDDGDDSADTLLGRFLDYVKALPNYRTIVETGSGEGVSVSCKTGP